MTRIDVNSVDLRTRNKCESHKRRPRLETEEDVSENHGYTYRKWRDPSDERRGPRGGCEELQEQMGDEEQSLGSVVLRSVWRTGSEGNGVAASLRGSDDSPYVDLVRECKDRDATHTELEGSNGNGKTKERQNRPSTRSGREPSRHAVYALEASLNSGAEVAGARMNGPNRENPGCVRRKGSEVFWKEEMGGQRRKFQGRWGERARGVSRQRLLAPPKGYLEWPTIMIWRSIGVPNEREQVEAVERRKVKGMMVVVERQETKTRLAPNKRQLGDGSAIGCNGENSLGKCTKNREKCRENWSETSKTTQITNHYVST
ncbi:hypothetical protein C8R42DRAFT_644915 [Lentinula raphanica]|nr:hypothetical protein C8R42DRAFT_644915 [Lentinula raphanica]